jgi:hypothetical protein
VNCIHPGNPKNCKPIVAYGKQLQRMWAFGHNGLGIHEQRTGPDRSREVGIHDGWDDPDQLYWCTIKGGGRGNEKEHLQEHHMAAQHEAPYLCSMGRQQYCQDVVNCHSPEMLQGEFAVKQKKG